MCTSQVENIFLLYYSNGNVYLKGVINKNDLREGLWEEFYSNGTIWSTGKWDNGDPIGLHLTFLRNGLEPGLKIYYI